MIKFDNIQIKYGDFIAIDNLNLDIHECMKTIYEHINNIDYHDPFEDKEILDVINSLPIEYLVFELIGDTREELEDKIQRQWKIFN